jgi:hypothetical protein
MGTAQPLAASDTNAKKLNRNEIIEKLRPKFQMYELVCDHTLKKFGEQSWQFLNTELLETLMVLRFDIFNVGMTVNYGTSYQRGLRCNICPLVLEKTNKKETYLSSHCTGAGVDINFTGFTAEAAREHIRKNADKLPYPIRLEKDVNWVHIDVYNDGSGKKIVEFAE